MFELYNNRLFRALLVVTLIVSVSGVCIISFQQIHQRLLSSRIHFIEEKINEIEQVVESYHQLSLYGRMTSEQAQQAALRTVSEMRFGDNDYFWVVDFDGLFVMHPIDETLVGRPIEVIDTRDDEPLFKKVPRMLTEQGGGVVHYRWPKPGSKLAVDKISYLRSFEPWGWGLGSGVYIDDINGLFWEEIENLVIVGAVLILILLLFWYGFQQAIFKHSGLNRSQ
ncbi:MAG: cache domain-containing protein [Halopseudomonas sp.]